MPPDSPEFVEAKRGLAELAKVKVVAFERTGEGDDKIKPYRLVIENGSDRAFGIVGVEIAVRSLDRDIPWTTGKAFVEIPGGVHPGETKTIDVDAMAKWADVPQGEAFAESFDVIMVGVSPRESIYYQGMDRDARNYRP